MDLANKIRNGDPLDERERQLASHIIAAFSQAYYEKTGCMFISGSGDLKEDGFPDYVLVCPAYGSDGSVMYRRT